MDDLQYLNSTSGIPSTAENGSGQAQSGSHANPNLNGDLRHLLSELTQASQRAEQSHHINAATGPSLESEYDEIGRHLDSASDAAQIVDDRLDALLHDLDALVAALESGSARAALGAQSRALQEGQAATGTSSGGEQGACGDAHEEQSPDVAQTPLIHRQLLKQTQQSQNRVSNMPRPFRHPSSSRFAQEQSEHIGKLLPDHIHVLYGDVESILDS